MNVILILCFSEVNDWAILMLLYLNTFQESKQIETCMRQNDC